MEEKFAVIIPVSEQIGYDTFKDTYKVLLLSKKMTIEEIMEEVSRVAPLIRMEYLHFSTVIPTSKSTELKN